MYEFLDRRYAQALYDIARNNGKVEQYISDLDQVVDLIETNKDVKHVIENPEISTKDKKNFFTGIFKDRLDADLLTFLNILIEKDRIMFLKEKVTELKKIDFENKNIKIAQVTTAVPLTVNQKIELIQRLSKKHSANIELEETVNPEIIGGIIIKVGDELIDASVRSTLDDIKLQILE